MPKVNTSDIEITDDANPGAEDGIEVAEEDEAQQDADESAESEVVEEATKESGDTDTEGGTTDEGEITISVGEQPAAEEEDASRAPEWVRDLRKSNREKDRVIREKDAEIARLKGATSQPEQVVVGEEPTFEACDFDPDKFRDELTAWNARKAKAEQQQKERETAQAAEQQKWQARISAVQTEAAKLRQPDYEATVEALDSVFSVAQRGIVINGPADPKTSAALSYWLGKNPKKAQELAGITDLIRFSFAIAHLEAQLKVTPKKSAPPPERVVRSSVPGAAAIDNQLEKLRAEAAKTGDLSKVLEYKRRKRQA